MTRRTRRALAAAAGAGIVCASIALGGPALTTATASAASTYSAVAAAEGLRMAVLAENGPVTNTPIEIGGPVAQSIVDSLGVSRSFGSHPYPGELPVSGPGLVAGVTQGAVNLPAYPWYVNAEYPAAPERSVDQGALSLVAKAAERSSSAAGTSGVSSDQLTAGLAKASAVTEAQPSGAVRSAASSALRGVAVGPLVIGQLLASAETIREADGKVAKRAELVATGVTVGGIGVAVTPAGLQVADTKVPFADTAAVQHALDEAGMRVRYVAGREDATGVVSPALEISFTRPVDSPVTRTGVILVFGAAVARVDGAGAAAGPATDIPPSDPTAPATSAPDVDTTSSPARTTSGSQDLPVARAPIPVAAGARLSFAGPPPGSDSAAGGGSYAATGDSLAAASAAPAVTSPPAQTPRMAGAVPVFHMKAPYAAVGLAAGLLILTVGGFSAVRPQRKER